VRLVELLHGVGFSARDDGGEYLLEVGEGVEQAAVVLHHGVGGAVAGQGGVQRVDGGRVGDDEDGDTALLHLPGKKSEYTVQLNYIANNKGGYLCDFFFFKIVYSTLLHLPPLRFHCADGCWDRPRDRCNCCIGSIFIEQ
jgi:hypothetical protein